jgi:hypothetical protein
VAAILVGMILMSGDSVMFFEGVYVRNRDNKWELTGTHTHTILPFIVKKEKI